MLFLTWGFLTGQVKLLLGEIETCQGVGNSRLTVDRQFGTTVKFKLIFFTDV